MTMPARWRPLARAFRLAGHEATVCDNANRALELVKSQPFDMMLSDVVMPGKDGHHAAGRAAQSRASRCRW
jgi:CheY-like chemotaxis protein